MQQHLLVEKNCLEHAFREEMRKAAERKAATEKSAQPVAKPKKAPQP